MLRYYRGDKRGKRKIRKKERLKKKELRYSEAGEKTVGENEWQWMKVLFI